MLAKEMKIRISELNKLSEWAVGDDGPGADAVRSIANYVIWRVKELIDIGVKDAGK